MRTVAIALAATVALSAFSRTSAQPSPDPRIAPVADRALTPLQRSLVAAYVPAGQQLTNDVRTLLNHPDSIAGVLPFWNYIASQSTLSPRDRALLILRTAWRSNAAYLWARYATAATMLTRTDLQRLTTAANGGESFDDVLIRAADGLHQRSFVDDGTWAALKGRYGTEQLMDAVFTVAETSMLAAIVNSARVPIDATFTAALPGRAPAATAARDHPVLAAPRIPPLEQTFWTGELRAMLDPDGTGREVAAVYRTFAQHPALYRPRQELSEYIRVKSTLPARFREMAILRIGFLCGSEYEWAAHVRAGASAGLSPDEIRRIAVRGRVGWGAADAAVLQGVDELFAQDMISDATWSRLAGVLDQRQLIDFLITTGGYRMVSMALNTFGVPLEAGSARFPS